GRAGPSDRRHAEAGRLRRRGRGDRPARRAVGGADAAGVRRRDTPPRPGDRRRGDRLRRPRRVGRRPRQGRRGRPASAQGDVRDGSRDGGGMALTVVVFDVGETLVDEATTYRRWEAEGVTSFV